MTALRASGLLLLVGGLWLALAGFSNEPVSIAVEGARYQYEPATVRLRVRVEPNAANRELDVALWSGGERAYGSRGQLDGEKASITRWVAYKDVQAGEYIATATVFRQGAEPVQGRSKLTVLGRY